MVASSGSFDVDMCNCETKHTYITSIATATAIATRDNETLVAHWLNDGYACGPIVAVGIIRDPLEAFELSACKSCSTRAFGRQLHVSEALEMGASETTH